MTFWSFVALGFAERCVLVAAALANLSHPRLAGACLVILALLLVARGWTRGLLQARVELGLHRAVTTALLSNRVWQVNPLGSEDPEAGWIEGTYAGTRLLVDVLPQLAMDGLASAAVVALLPWVLPPVTLLAGVGALVALALAAGYARRRILSEADRAWDAYRPVMDAMATTLGGRAELVGNGREQTYLATVDRQLATWTATAMRSERSIALAARFPIAVALLIATTLLWVGTGSALPSLVTRDLVILAAVVPVFAGVLRSALEIGKTSVRFRPIAQFLDEASNNKGIEPIGAHFEVKLVGTDVAREADFLEPLRIDRICVKYAPEGPSVLSALSLVWGPSDLLVLTGPNGSGKSTVLRALTGVIPLVEGRIALGDAPVEISRLREHVGYLTQRPYFGPRQTVEEAFLWMAPYASADQTRRELEAMDLWARLEAKSGLGTKVVDLSSGEQQRLAIARLFCTNRSFLLLDEPDANLDARGQSLLCDRLLKAHAAGSRVLVAAHSDELVHIATKRVHLERGHLP